MAWEGLPVPEALGSLRASLRAPRERGQTISSSMCLSPLLLCQRALEAHARATSLLVLLLEKGFLHLDSTILLGWRR